MIEILNYEHADKNKVIGYVDVKLTIKKPTEIIFRRIAHLDNQGKKWLNLASFPKQMNDGSQKYLRYAEFSDQSHNTAFAELLSEAVKNYLENPKEEIIPF